MEKNGNGTGLTCWAYGTVISRELESVKGICNDLKAHAGDDSFKSEFEVLDARMRSIDDFVGRAVDECGMPDWLINGWMQLKKHYGKNKTEKFYEDIDMFNSIIGIESAKLTKPPG